MRSRPPSSADRAARCARGLLAAAATAALVGCAHGERPAVVHTVALAPVDTLGVPAEEGRAFQQAVRREVERSSVARLPPEEPEGEGAPAQVPSGSCGDSAVCLAGIGSRLRTDWVLSLTLAGLGDLRLVRSRLLQSADGLVLQDLQETVPSGETAREQYAAELTRRLFPEAPRRPWYRHWGVWSAAGLVVAAGVVTTWALARSGPDESGVYHLGDL